MKPYLLRSPQLDPVSGGIRVMYGLYGWLLAKGQLAYLNAQIEIPSVGIYPEIYHGNDMGSQRVIRYILQKPGMMATEGVAGPTEFNLTDELYVFSKVYDEWESPDDHILFLPIIDLHTFKDYSNKRDKVAFYVGKGENIGKHPVEAVEITREFARDQTALANILNECQTLYVYDHLSAIMEIARLCGCEVVYLGDMPEKQLKLYEPGMNGLGYGKEEKLYSKDFRQHYKSLIRTFEFKLDTFIENTQ